MEKFIELSKLGLRPYQASAGERCEQRAPVNAADARVDQILGGCPSAKIMIDPRVGGIERAPRCSHRSRLRLRISISPI